MPVDLDRRPAVARQLDDHPGERPRLPVPLQRLERADPLRLGDRERIGRDLPYVRERARAVRIVAPVETGVDELARRIERARDVGGNADVGDHDVDLVADLDLAKDLLDESQNGARGRPVVGFGVVLRESERPPAPGPAHDQHGILDVVGQLPAELGDQQDFADAPAPKSRNVIESTESPAVANADAREKCVLNRQVTAFADATVTLADART